MSHFKAALKMYKKLYIIKNVSSFEFHYEFEEFGVRSSTVLLISE